jgi:glycosyltransferase involved in cell wall biosynthesis
VKHILYLTFYYEPDLCAGSFRNSPLIKELSRQAGEDITITVIATMPNRYQTFKTQAPAYVEDGNMLVHRIQLPEHKSGFVDQALSFVSYYRKVSSITENKPFDLVVASSSRLFTAYLGYRIAKEKKAKLYLDIRDIFYDTMKDVIKNKVIRLLLLPFLKYLEERTFSNADHINLISGGFKSYFEKYSTPIYTYFSNGVDDEFINLPPANIKDNNQLKRIIYAGNIGEGQGLNTIIPCAAKQLSGEYEFVIIGDGGKRPVLESEIKKLNLDNVKISNPVKRTELLKEYLDSDYLFLHLNDYDAFKKVLPSKIFELAAFDLPVIAGVQGFAREFIENNVSNHILFYPGNSDELVQKLKAYNYRREKRSDFIEKFRRTKLNRDMASSMLEYLKY